MGKLNVKVIPTTIDGIKSGTLILENELGIENIDELRLEMLEIIKDFQQLEIKVKEAKAIDLTTLQLLYAVKQSYSLQNKKIAIKLDIHNENRKLIECSGYAIILNLS
jgi:hypothetical protein